MTCSFMSFGQNRNLIDLTFYQMTVVKKKKKGTRKLQNVDQDFNENFHFVDEVCAIIFTASLNFRSKYMFPKHFFWFFRLKTMFSSG